MKRRRLRNRRSGRRPEIAVSQILAWADTFHERVGRWPHKVDGRIAGGLGLTWLAVDKALRYGNRGLPGGSSLARLLAERRGVRNSRALPRLRVAQILAWADAHHQRTGRWPAQYSGRVPGAPFGLTWLAIDHAL